MLWVKYCQIINRILIKYAFQPCQSSPRRSISSNIISNSAASSTGKQVNTIRKKLPNWRLLSGEYPIIKVPLYAICSLTFGATYWKRRWQRFDRIWQLILTVYRRAHQSSFSSELCTRIAFGMYQKQTLEYSC